MSGCHVPILKENVGVIINQGECKMKFAEALSALQERKMVARKSWTESDGYLVFLSGMKHIWKIITKPAPNAGNHIFSVDELSADDWEVVEGSNVVEPPKELCDAA